MEWMPILNEIFQLCIVPLLAVLTTYIVKFIQFKADEIAFIYDSETEQKYINMLADTISDCVVATNQTYVEALKDKNAFDAEAQKTAFKMTFDAVMDVLSQEAKDYLTEVYGDLTAYITNRIEASVNANK